MKEYAKMAKNEGIYSAGDSARRAPMHGVQGARRARLHGVHLGAESSFETS
jgi:hypothetical protein